MAIDAIILPLRVMAFDAKLASWVSFLVCFPNCKLCLDSSVVLVLAHSLPSGILLTVESLGSIMALVVVLNNLVEVLT